MSLVRRLQSFRRDERGVVMVEFAIAAPVLVIMVMAVVRIGGFLLERMAVERATSEVAAIAAHLPATEPDTAQKNGLDRIFRGVGFAPPEADYRVIVQSFTNNGAGYPADWSAPVSLGDLAADSRVTSGGMLSEPGLRGAMPQDSRWLVIESFRRNFRFSLDYFISTPDAVYSRRSVPARG